MTQEVEMGVNATQGLEQFSQSLAVIIDKVQSSVVHISGRNNGPVSGLVIGTDTVLTTSQKLLNDKEIIVTSIDRRLDRAIIAGRDPERDLAVIRLQKLSLTPAIFSDGEPALGEMVVALGRPNTTAVQASLGIIGRLDGPLRFENGTILEKFYQTDAAPFIGFSGSALINTQGEITGINSTHFPAILATTIPIRIALDIASVLQLYGHVRRGYLGIRSQKVRLYANHRRELGRRQLTGLAVIRVEPDSPAARANLMVGDVITRIDRQVINNHSDLLAQIGPSSFDRTLKFEVLRGSERMFIHVPIREHH
jgi:S1-C subfamily serine protease